MERALDDFKVRVICVPPYVDMVFYTVIHAFRQQNSRRTYVIVNIEK